MSKLYFLISLSSTPSPENNIYLFSMILFFQVCKVIFSLDVFKKLSFIY